MSLAKSELLLSSQFYPTWAKAVTDSNAILGQNSHRFDPHLFRTIKVVSGFESVWPKTLTVFARSILMRQAYFPA